MFAAHQIGGVSARKRRRPLHASRMASCHVEQEPSASRHLGRHCRPGGIHRRDVTRTSGRSIAIDGLGHPVCKLPLPVQEEVFRFVSLW